MDGHRHRHRRKFPRRTHLLRHRPHRQMGVDREARRQARNHSQTSHQGGKIRRLASSPIVGAVRRRHLRRGSRLLPHKIFPYRTFYVHRKVWQVYCVVLCLCSRFERRITVVQKSLFFIKKYLVFRLKTGIFVKILTAQEEQILSPRFFRGGDFEQ